MTHEVAKILAGSLETMQNESLITTLCGLVKTAQQKRDNATIRFPVPYDQDAAIAQMANSDLIPDRGQRAIVYFEGQDTTLTSNLRKSWAETSIRLVCWYNSSLFQQAEGSLHTELIRNVLGLVQEAKPPRDGAIVAFTAKSTRVVDSHVSLFSKYSYAQERGQYLLSPYFAFGIDFDVTFQINHGCRTKPIAIQTRPCC